MCSSSSSPCHSHKKGTSDSMSARELSYIQTMCQDLSTKPNTTVDDFVNKPRGLTTDSICEHYRVFITHLKESRQDYESLTLATYKRISHEKSFTRKTAAFILGLKTRSNITRLLNLKKCMKFWSERCLFK